LRIITGTLEVLQFGFLILFLFFLDLHLELFLLGQLDILFFISSLLCFQFNSPIFEIINSFLQINLFLILGIELSFKLLNSLLHRIDIPHLMFGVHQLALQSLDRELALITDFFSSIIIFGGASLFTNTLFALRKLLNNAILFFQLARKLFEST